MTKIRPVKKKKPDPEWISFVDAERRFVDSEGKKLVDRRTLGEYAGEGKIRDNGKKGRACKYKTSDVLAAIDQIMVNKEGKETTSDMAAEKRRLECERLRVIIKKEIELLEQAKIETHRLKKDIVTRREIEDYMNALLRTVKARCEAFRSARVSHCRTAKQKDAIDELTSTFEKTLGDGLRKWQDEYSG